MKPIYIDIHIHTSEDANNLNDTYNCDILMENVNKDNILLSTIVEKIDLEKHEATLNNGEVVVFENLINTAPFNAFLKLTNNEEYNKLSDRLTYNKVLVFNLGFNKKSKYDKEHWIYFPDKSINFYRVGFYDNILSSDKLSMYIEIGYSKDTIIDDTKIQEELNKTLEGLRRVGIIDETFDLVAYESIIMNPAYVHIDTENDKQVRKIMNDLSNQGVYSIGRYGAWTYCSMEDCMLEAKNLSEKI